MVHVFRSTRSSETFDKRHHNWLRLTSCVDLLDFIVIVIANIVTLVLLERITKGIPDADSGMRLRPSRNSSLGQQLADGTTARAAGLKFWHQDHIQVQKLSAAGALAIGFNQFQPARVNLLILF